MIYYDNYSFLRKNKKCLTPCTISAKQSKKLPHLFIDEATDHVVRLFDFEKLRQNLIFWKIDFWAFLTFFKHNVCENYTIELCA